jgi:ATP synthase F1 delta subunit
MSINKQLIAANYARALSLEVRVDDDLDDAIKHLDLFNNHLKSMGSLGKALLNPKIPVSAKQDAFNFMLTESKLKGVAKNFIQIVAQNNRLDLLGLILRNLNKLFIKRQGAKVITITTVSSCSNELKMKLTKEVEKSVKTVFDCKKFITKFAINEKILGGMIVDVDSKIIDLSLRSRIQKIKNALIN